MNKLIISNKELELGSVLAKALEKVKPESTLDTAKGRELYAHRVLEECNKRIDGFGIEALLCEEAYIDRFWSNCIGLYVNMGDTYAPTVIYDTEDNDFIVASWGEFFELREASIKYEKQF